MSRAAGNESTSDHGRDPAGCVKRTTAGSDAAPAKPRRPRRRWFQFSIRGLLLVTLLVAGLLSAWKVYLLPYYRQKAAVAELDEVGMAHVSKPARGPSWPGWLLGEQHYVRVVTVFDRNEGRYTPQERQRILRALEQLPFVEAIGLGGGFTDDDLAYLRNVQSLTSLGFTDSPIQGDGLRHLACLKRLRRFSCERCTHFGDAGMAELAKHRELERLDLSGTQVTDAGLSALSRLTRLQQLSLEGTRASDAALEHISGLRGLERLNLGRTRVTDAGLRHVAALRELHVLVLEDTSVAGTGLVHLRDAKPGMLLALNGTRVDARAMDELAQLPLHSVVHLASGQWAAQALAEIKCRRPDLRFPSLEFRCPERQPPTEPPIRPRTRDFHCRQVCSARARRVEPCDDTDLQVHHGVRRIGMFRERCDLATERRRSALGAS